MTESPRPPGPGDTPAPDPTTPPPPPGGYAPPPPPPGGYAPPPGAYPPGPGSVPPGHPTNDDRTWALIAHFGGAAGAFVSFGPLGFVAPLVAYLAKGQQSPVVRAHAVAALNFQLLWSAIAFVVLWFSWCLVFVPSLVVFAIQIIFGIIAGVKASEGQPYRYPMSATFIK